jgi:predicted Fe-Mo cluster-binding NifX family protein
MKSKNLRQNALALVLCSLISAFAQEPEKIAVYVSGAGDAGINKSFGSKLLFAITQSGKYAEIENSEAFYNELAKNFDGSTGKIAQTAKQHGADAVCAVGMTEAFGAYSISARLIKTSNSQVLKAAALDRSLKSLDDLTAVSKELAAQLLELPPPVPQTPTPKPAATTEPAAIAPAAATPKDCGGDTQTFLSDILCSAAAGKTAAAAKSECANKFNINELASKIQSGFPASLKDCSSTLAKNIAMSKSPFGKKTELKEPKAFMTECAIDGIKQKLPQGTDEYIKPVEGFLQNILNVASAADGSLDVKKLSGAIGGMNVMDLVNELKAKAANDNCAVDEPYTQTVESDGGGSDKKDDRKLLSFGIRLGFNFSYLDATYYDVYRGRETGSYGTTPGFQLGLVLDIAPISWLHIQPGVMYIQKGTEDNGNGGAMTFHYAEVPLLLSLKLSMLRLNIGPYFEACLSGKCGDDIDIGLSMGFGFDIRKFYVGAFYDYGFDNSYYYYDGLKQINGYNRTLGFNFGINL